MRLITSLDLEMNQPSGKIISVGIVQGDIDTGEIVLEKQWFVSLNEHIEAYIRKLTGIDDNILQTQGQPLPEIYEELKAIHLKAHYKNPLTWGGGDTQTLMDELKRDHSYKFSEGFENPDKLEVFAFGHRSFDCKQQFQIECMRDNKGLQSGLSKSMSRCGVQFIGRKHEALSDARNTFRFFYYLTHDYKVGDIKK